jgi:hypothetical protein
MLPPESAEPNRYLNYLHYGNALDVLSAIVLPLVPMKTVDKAKLIDALRSSSICRTRRELVEVSDVIKYFRHGASQTIDLMALESAITSSRWWQDTFRLWRCRGFSFRLACSPHLPVYATRRDVNLRIALLVDQALYYPPSVRQALRDESMAKRFSHLPGAIGWALGREGWLGEDKCWFLLNVQSDLMRTRVACLREVFRGWQRVLVGLIVGLAQLQAVSKIALPRAEEVVLTTRFYKGLRRVPSLWETLYDRTGEEFGMSPVTMRERVDLQVVGGWPAVLSSELLLLDLTRGMDRPYGECISRLECVSDDLTPSWQPLFSRDYPSL